MASKLRHLFYKKKRYLCARSLQGGLQATFITIAPPLHKKYLKVFGIFSKKKYSSHPILTHIIKKTMTPRILLIPTPINTSEHPLELSLPSALRAQVEGLDYFVVENLRSARRFLSRLKLSIPIDQMQFAELSEHTDPEDVEAMLEPLLKQNRSIGIISEAGLPCVADPGALLVAAAHRHSIEVVPLVGPSSIMLALMASGANGQSFAFNGYLPIKNPDRAQAIQRFERRTLTENQSQIFIETPYRNLNLMSELLQNLSGSTMLTVACELTNPDSQLIATKSVAQWRNSKTPDIQKKPAIFIFSNKIL